jgi:hypothetical protein
MAGRKKTTEEIMLLPIYKTFTISATVVTALAILLLCLYFYTQQLPIYHPNWRYGQIVCKSTLPSEMVITVEVTHIDDPEFRELLYEASRRCK